MLAVQPLSVDPGGQHLGLRERKKLAARRRIAEAAHDLFVARGFDHVTMADVAAAAEMSVKTVFNYFGTKEDLAFEGEDWIIATWLNAIRHRPAGDTPLQAVSTLIAAAVDADMVARLDAFADLVAASTDLQSRLRLLWARLESAVARLLVAEHDATDPADEGRALAAARVEAARIVALPRLYFSDEVRAYLAESPDRDTALADWLAGAIATLSGVVGSPADAR